MTVSEIALSSTAPASRIPAPHVVAAPYVVGEEPDSAGASPLTVSTALHSFRRHWVAIILIGGFLAAGLGCLAWTLSEDSFQATATLRVTAKHRRILSDSTAAEGTDFEIYKRTQRQLISSQGVLAAVLQRDAVGKLPIVRQEDDQIGWLQRSMSVSYPDDAEIMLISFRCNDQNAAQIIANEVLDVYMTEIVGDEHQRNQERPVSLRKALDEVDVTLRTKREDIKRLADSLGTGDAEALTLAQKNTLDEYAMLLGQLRQIDVELIRKDRELKLANVQVAEADMEGDGEAEQAASLEAMWKVVLESDLVHSQLTRAKAAIGDQRAEILRTVAPAKATPFLTQLTKDEEEVDRKLAAREALLRLSPDGAEASRRSTAALEIELLQEEKAQWQAKVEAHRKAAEKFGRSSVEIDLLRAEVESINDLRQQLQSEYQAAKLETGESLPRIKVLSKAQMPRTPDRFRKAVKPIMAGLAGLGMWAWVVVFWDIRKGRLNASDQLSQKLGIPVIGSLPLVRRRRGRLLHTDRLTESVDAVAASILCQPLESPIRTILITSAVPGEGKTTLAANLAKSLAAAGRSTLLIDFDLRRPALHRLFGYSVEGGISEILSGDKQLEDVLHVTETEGLAFLSAGDSSLTSFSHLTSAGIRQFFDSLRDQFDYIVVDAAPILPVVDTRLVARQVDAVLISILRDRSEIGKVAAAKRMLEAFGAPVLGVVMTGCSSDVYYQRYQPVLTS